MTTAHRRHEWGTTELLAHRYVTLTPNPVILSEAQRSRRTRRVFLTGTLPNLCRYPRRGFHTTNTRTCSRFETQRTALVHSSNHAETAREHS